MIFKICIFAIITFFILYVISFFVTETSYVPEYEYPQAYGRKTLDYQAKPVITFIVWQKNEIGYQSERAWIGGGYQSPASKIFYTRKHINLTAGNKLLTTSSANGSEPVMRLPFTVVYDGKFHGWTDIILKEVLYYDKDDNTVPGYWFESVEGDFNKDGTFDGNDRLALSIAQISAEYPEYYEQQTTVKPREYFRDWVSQYETTEEFDFDRFFRLESFHDVYPDAPEIFTDFERVVLTQRIYIEAYHPYKSDLIVASGVIAVNTYSSWNTFFSSPEEEAAFELYDYERGGYREFEVDSYSQSDWFSME